MKINKRTAVTAFSLVFMGSAVFSQSLPDAKKAIDAEQYQKAKAMLKNLTVTQSTKDENYFYLGLVYIKQDYPDSAKNVFNRGLAVNPKSALNYVGLGMVDRLDKSESSARSNFDKAISMAGKDDKPYVYVGKAYLIAPADAKSAIAVLEKGKTVGTGAKDAELFSTLGDAYREQLNSNQAYTNYSQAQSLDPKNAAVNVAIGNLWRRANNYDDADKQFQAALAIDPNYGPAYREWAETDLQQAKSDNRVASAKVKEGAEYYKKYLDLTDRSLESRMRYADFLINAGDYKSLQQEAQAISSMPGANLRASRYAAYAAYENGDYPAGLTAMNNFMSKADPKRIIPRDYMYLGRLQLKSGQDSLGINNLRKALTLDTSDADAYGEIAKSLYSKRKYLESAEAYDAYIKKSRNHKLGDYFSLGLSYYFAYNDEYYRSEKNKSAKPDPSLLVKADTAFAYVNKNAASPVPDVVLYRAYVNDLMEPERNAIKGLAKPYFEQYISLVSNGEKTAKIKANLGEAYAYLGSYYEFSAKDPVKANENFAKSLEADPANKQAKAFFARKGGTAAKGK
jgi:Tfp pilus assembly protein PilF